MTDKCQKEECKSTRIADVSGKTSDMFFLSYNGKEHDGYVLGNIGIGNGDYIRFSYCLECGQIQDKFPVADPDPDAEIDWS